MFRFLEKRTRIKRRRRTKRSKIAPAFFLSLLLCSLIPLKTWCQQNLEIINGDLKLLNPNEEEKSIYWLYKNGNGQVQLRQDDITLESDSTQFYSAQNFAKAFGNVYINQGDTLDIYANNGEYFGNEQQATLIGEVSMQNGPYSLNTERLDYDLAGEIATYRQGGELQDTSSVLTSKKGKYFAAEERAVFWDSVVLVTKDQQIETDSLNYDMTTGVAEFNGPTKIIEGERTINTTKGWYNTKTGKAQFESKPVIEDEKIRFESEFLDYGGEDGKTVAKGGIYFLDKEKQVELRAQEATLTEGDTTYARGKVHVIDLKEGYELEADEADILQNSNDFFARGNAKVGHREKETELLADDLQYHEGKGYILARDKPFLTSVYEGDSVFMIAETIEGFRQERENDTTYNFVANKRLKLYKSDIQAVADSSYFNALDSTLTLFKNPVIWADSSQMTADTIKFFIENRTIDRIELRNRAYIIQEIDSGLYDQIKGRNIDAFFVDKKIDNMLVDGNAETIYYLRDDDNAFIGVNEMKCGRIRVKFKEEKIEEIFWLNKPEGTTHPFQDIDPTTFLLPGFVWRAGEQPLSKYDLLRASGRLEVKPGDRILEEFTPGKETTPDRQIESQPEEPDKRRERPGRGKGIEKGRRPR